LKDGMKKILLYGNITDVPYYEKFVRPLMMQHINIVEHKGYQENKQWMYDSITDCYLSSRLETWSYIKKECDMTGTTFHGCKAVEGNHTIEMTNEEIFKNWCRELGF